MAIILQNLSIIITNKDQTAIKIEEVALAGVEVLVETIGGKSMKTTCHHVLGKKKNNPITSQATHPEPEVTEAGQIKEIAIEEEVTIKIADHRLLTTITAAVVKVQKVEILLLVKVLRRSIGMTKTWIEGRTDEVEATPEITMPIIMNVNRLHPWFRAKLEVQVQMEAGEIQPLRGTIAEVIVHIETLLVPPTIDEEDLATSEVEVVAVATADMNIILVILLIADSMTIMSIEIMEQLRTVEAMVIGLEADPKPTRLLWHLGFRNQDTGPRTLIKVASASTNGESTKITTVVAEEVTAEAINLDGPTSGTMKLTIIVRLIMRKMTMMTRPLDLTSTTGASK